MSQYGKVYALAKGPYGRSLALAWKLGSPAVLVDVLQPEFNWQLPNSTELWPHDFALGPAALSLTGAGDRLLAVYVAPLCNTCGPVKKYILFPNTFGAPDKDTPPPVLVPTSEQPLLAHMHSEGHHPAEQAQAAAVARAAAGLEAVADGVNTISAENEQLDEQEEEAAEQQEDREDQHEMKQMADPQLVQQLQLKLEALQQQLREYKDKDADQFITIHTAGLHISSRHALAGAMVVIAVGLLLGVAFVLHMLRTPPKAVWAAQQLGICVAYDDAGKPLPADEVDRLLPGKLAVLNQGKSLYSLPRPGVCTSGHGGLQHLSTAHARS